MNSKSPPKENYSRVKLHTEFIVVDGGSAEAMIASRLFEIENIKLYRQQNRLIIDIPMIGNKYNQPHEKVLDSSKILNTLIYMRGNRLNYDKRARLDNTNWSYEKVSPYFLKYGNNRNPYS
ncbi:hypothetical protein V1477_003526 [Vespula maculifrons]|uniref:Uncharacterized protein n=1 Tax=Vespula maculifrons TaxID=7453 RepID=A0ABD2CSY8_VESMC